MHQNKYKDIKMKLNNSCTELTPINEGQNDPATQKSSHLRFLRLDLSRGPSIDETSS